MTERQRHTSGSSGVMFEEAVEPGAASVPGVRRLGLLRAAPSGLMPTHALCLVFAMDKCGDPRYRQVPEMGRRAGEASGDTPFGLRPLRRDL